MKYTVNKQSLPVGNYVLSKHEDDFLLTSIDDFTLPEKIYGNTNSERYLKSFTEGDRSMGILMVGIKGGGKTMEAKKLCIDSGLPVIIVSQAFDGDPFHKFISTLDQEVVVFMDEFDKVYTEEQQEQLLPILDGVFSSKKLFVLTSNSMNVSQYLKNRTGRIRYLKKFEGVEEEVIKEVIDNKLNDKDNEEGLLAILELLSTVSMDNLINLIEEMNRFGETADKAMQHLNIQVEHIDFDVLMFIDGKRSQKRVYFNPLVVSYISIPYQVIDDKGRTHHEYYHKAVDDMQLTISDGDFHYTDHDNNVLIFTPVKSNKKDFLQLIGDV